MQISYYEAPVYFSNIFISLLGLAYFTPYKSIFFTNPKKKNMLVINWGPFNIPNLGAFLQCWAKLNTHGPGWTCFMYNKGTYQQQRMI